MTGEKRKASSVENDWEADRKAEDVPQLSRDLGKKLKTDMDTEKAEEEGFPERAYKACPAHLNKVADRLGEHIDSHSELETAYQRLVEENADLKRKLAEALASKPPQDPTTKTKPGPLPHHLHAQITDTTPAVEQGHFRYESHVDLLVANLLTHYFPLQHLFYVGPQQTFMTGTIADQAMIDIANSWSFCVEAADTTRVSSEASESGFLDVPFLEGFALEGFALSSTPRRESTWYAAEQQPRWDNVENPSVEDTDLREAPDLPHLSPLPDLTSPPEQSFSAAPQVALLASQLDPLPFGAPPLPVVREPDSTQVWDDMVDPFLDSTDRSVPNIILAPPPANPAAEPSSSSSPSADPVPGSITPDAPLPSSQVNPADQDAWSPYDPSQRGLEPDLSQHELPSFDGFMPEISPRSVMKDPPSVINEWLVVDVTGRYIINQRGRATIKRPDFRVVLLEDIRERIFKNLVIVEDKLRSGLAAVSQLLSYMTDLGEGGGNRLALGLAVVFTTNFDLEVAMFRRETEDGPIKNIGAKHRDIDGKPHAQFAWYALNSVEVREQLLQIWEEEMGALGPVRSP